MEVKVLCNDEYRCKLPGYLEEQYLNGEINGEEIVQALDEKLWDNLYDYTIDKIIIE